MNKKYTKTKAKKSINIFLQFSQFYVWRELILGNNISKSICCWNRNSQMFGWNLWSQRLTEKRYLWQRSYSLTSMLSKSHKNNPHNANVEPLIIAVHYLCVLPLVHVCCISSITIYFSNIVFTNDANFWFCRVKWSAYQIILNIFLLIFKCNKGFTLLKLFNFVI